MFKCHCGEVHDSMVQGYCPVGDVTPKSVGAEIRRLLMLLHAPGHSVEDERSGYMNYGTDELRMQALDYAGICWLTPGEMAPGCCCEWSPEKPDGPRLRMKEDQEECRRLWADECITRDHARSGCLRGTPKCVVKHREGATSSSVHGDL